MNQATLLFFLVIIGFTFALENNEIETDNLLTEQKQLLPRHHVSSSVPCQHAKDKAACWQSIHKKHHHHHHHHHHRHHRHHTHYINQTTSVCWNQTKTYDVTRRVKSTSTVIRQKATIVPTCSQTVVAVPVSYRTLKSISRSKSISKSKSRSRSKSKSKSISKSKSSLKSKSSSKSRSLSKSRSISKSKSRSKSASKSRAMALSTQIIITTTETTSSIVTATPTPTTTDVAPVPAVATQTDTTDAPNTDTNAATLENDPATTDSESATMTNTATATTTSNDVLSTSTNNSDIYANSDAAAANDISNKALGIGLGAGIGCIAALGLAGLVVFNRKRRQERLSEDDSQTVPTRWRPQSFMGAVASVVSKLPRSPSQRSKASTDMLGVAVGHGQGATEMPSSDARQY
ncbi:uncharacterized protein ATC70_008048 [Mucor velutinosus]|uniref:Mid2 domain-containing protein n=1 Tax=Mucor velutinosus TaxID=708070 RepID=A0AAN7HVV8_9FUNG|nr:hypothetical protein ATC70_008048 [Mucor velutinosus]